MTLQRLGLAALFLAAACARGDDAATTDTQAATGDAATAADTPPARTTAPAASSTPASTADAPLALADLDLYVKGLQAEMKAAEEAVAKRRQAKTASDSLTEQFAALEMNTAPIAASQLGIPVERYRSVVERVGAVLSKRSVGGAILQQQRQVDTTGLPPDVRARVREGMAAAESAWGDPYKGLSPEVADAIRKRAAELDTLRARLMRERFRAAGQGG